MKLSKQELAIGSLSCLIFITRIWWLPMASAVLWAIGGSWKKSIRRYGIPVMVAMCLSNYWALMAIPVLHLGDGYPDNFSGDEGSWLGQQVYQVIGPHEVGGLITKLIPVMLVQVVWGCL